MHALERFFAHLEDPHPEIVGRSNRGALAAIDVVHHREPPATAQALRDLERLVPNACPALVGLWTAADGVLLYWPAAAGAARFWTYDERVTDSKGTHIDHSMLRFERIADWEPIRSHIRDCGRRWGLPNDQPDGVPIASVGGAGGWFVYDRNRVYYWSPNASPLHNQLVAPTMAAFLDMVVTDPARILADESVTRFTVDNQQFTPVAYISGYVAARRAR